MNRNQRRLDKKQTKGPGFAPIPEQFKQALALHKANRLEEAEQAYRRILELDPRHSDSLQLLGMIAHQAERFEIAAALMEQAIAIRGDNSFYHVNLGNTLTRLGLLDRAVACFRRALELSPDFAEAHNNLGDALRALGQPDEALPCFDHALSLNPGLAEAHNNRGNVLRDLGRLDEAAQSLERALTLRPGYSEAHSNLGLVMISQGRTEEAVGQFKRAVAQNPTFAEALNNLGGALQSLGRLDEAWAPLEKALTLRPSYALAHINLGNLLMERGRVAEAVARFKKATEAQDDCKEANDNLLFALCFQEDADPDQVFAEHRRFDERHIRPFVQFPTHDNDRSPERRLRIGYLSPDFRIHPGGHFLLPLLENHDRGRVEVFCYSNNIRTDRITDLCRSKTDHWRECKGLSDTRLAEMIRADRIDILVECAGHMEGNRVVMCGRHKPAPIMVAYPIYPNTTGVQTFDYRIMDCHTAPPWANAWHSEKLVRMPHAHVVYQPLTLGIEPSPEPPCLANGFVTFSSFNNFAKAGDRTVAVWSRILKEVPTAKLMIKWNGLGQATSGWSSERFKAQGIGPERLIFADFAPDPYTPYHRVDIALDPLASNGGTTTCDALWMGVPVVTQYGHTPFSRVGLCHLTNAGLPHLISDSTDLYVETAVSLAQDTTALIALRQGLRQRFAASPLMDGPLYTSHLEQAYRHMWQAWCAGEPPRDFDV